MFAATDRGWKAVNAAKPLAGRLEFASFVLALYPRVPGADENDGVTDVADLKDGGGPAAGGGRGGNEECAVFIEDDGGFCGGLRPGGGG